MNGPLFTNVHTAPQLSDAKAAREKLAELAGGPLDLALTEPRFAALIAGIADHSPYLWRLISADPERLARLAQEDPSASLERILATARAQTRSAADDHEAMAALRRAKQEAALVIALADIGGLWDVMRVTQALTQFADCMVPCALSFLGRDARHAAETTARRAPCNRQIASAPA
jgi:glutamate-ammonia-ligase adenylyltransferase